MSLAGVVPVRRERPHIVFLFSDTGGGHRSAANAMIEALELEYPGQTTQEMVDIFRQYAPPPFHRAPDIYPTLSRMPRVFGAGFHLSDGPRRTRLFYQMLWPYIRQGVQRLIAEHPADLIVSVHQLINAPMAWALARAEAQTPFVTVVTDLVTTHAFWYSNRADRVIVPTDIAFQRGVKYGVAPERMTVIGLPVAERFCQPVGDPCAARQKLGWPQDRTVVLLVGGGEGMGPLELTARAIDAARLPVALVIVAGRNHKLKERLERYAWRTPTVVHGFVQEMPDFMRAADILVTKAGPGTICEAFIAGLPMILYSRLNGQEEGNVDYVVDHGAGVWAPRPKEVVDALRRWLEHPAERQQAAQVCRRLARPQAARQIARLLMQQICPQVD